MPNEKRPFYQDLLIAAIPSIISFYAATMASSANNSASEASRVSEAVKKRQAFIQQRLDENSYISGDKGTLLAIGNDQMWIEYYSCRSRDRNNNRVTCSAFAKTPPNTTRPKVAEPIDLY